jgi:hypothetical protein
LDHHLPRFSQAQLKQALSRIVVALQRESDPDLRRNLAEILFKFAHNPANNALFSGVAVNRLIPLLTRVKDRDTLGYLAFSLSRLRPQAPGLLRALKSRLSGDERSDAIIAGILSAIDRRTLEDLEGPELHQDVYRLIVDPKAPLSSRLRAVEALRLVPDDMGSVLHGDTETLYHEMLSPKRPSEIRDAIDLTLWKKDTRTVQLALLNRFAAAGGDLDQELPGIKVGALDFVLTHFQGDRPFPVHNLGPCAFQKLEHVDMPVWLQKP